jgi:YbgC/YbaW family acyl-CoA thioester hydrolase
MEDDMKFRHTLPVQIRFSDVDQYGHMNNSSYFSLYDLAKTSYMRDVFGDKDWKHIGIVVANINADFLAPVFFSDDLVIHTSVIHLGLIRECVIMRNNKNSIVENVILFLVAIGVFAIIGGLAGWIRWR